MLDAFVVSGPVGAFIITTLVSFFFFLFAPKKPPQLKFLGSDSSDTDKADNPNKSLKDVTVIEPEAIIQEQKLCLKFLDDENLTDIKRNYEYILNINEKLSDDIMVSEVFTRKANKLTKQATEIIKKTGELYYLKDGILLGTVSDEDGKSEFIDYRELTLDKLEHLKEAIMLLLQSTSEQVIDDLKRINIDQSISGSKSIIRFNEVMYLGKTIAERMAVSTLPSQERFNVRVIVNKRMDELYDAYLAAFLNDGVNSTLAQKAFDDALDAIEIYFARLDAGYSSNAEQALAQLNINVRYIESITQKI